MCLVSNISTLYRGHDHLQFITKTRQQKWEEKQQYGYLKRQTCEIARENPGTWLRKGNLKRENESFLIAAQNNAIRTNYIKAKINYI